MFLSLAFGRFFHGPLLRIPFHYIHEYESLRSLRFNVLANQTNGATTEMSWSPMSWVHGIDPRLFHSPACHSLLSDHWDRIMSISILNVYVHNDSPGECQREASSVPKGNKIRLATSNLRNLLSIATWLVIIMLLRFKVSQRHRN